MTWNPFKEVFFKRYFPTFTRDAKADEFSVLTEGDMTMQGCDNPGHKARDCRTPKRDTPTSSVNRGGNKIPRGTSQANIVLAVVYSLTPMDANRARNAVTGATHFFVSVNFVRLCGVETQVMNTRLYVPTPFGSVTSCWRMLGDCPVEIQRRLLPVNLVARSFLLDGCQGYLVSVKDPPRDDLRLEDIRVVNEFPDVFPEDLPRLPPDREVKFAIELL
ncbi:uncharacterized protein LOC131156391 [Malania oleifera]|uniref:uncharacterized protein LOC131156391 n=1 Tax=Malania oleifera TaxID=397392 RepID=UPI0025ADE62B|nr:uncharacterized protein LOC131156391 [Malania oleifera]